jgi:hypothetical protein
MKVEPQPEHAWLQRMLGTWHYEHEAPAGPCQPAAKYTGSETVRTLGDVWVLCEGQGLMPDGGTGVTLMTLGFDPTRRRFVGTFIGSMMTHLWIYDGELSADRRTLTLNAEGPSFVAEGQMAKYQDIIQFESDDHRTLSSQYLGEDGQWHPFMTAHYRRGS